VALAGTDCAREGAQTLEVRSTAQPITYGSADVAPAHAAVVAIESPGVLCSGTLIAPRVVLTAAHCALTAPASLSVLFGPTVSAPVAQLRVLEILVHPGWDPDTLVDDLALLRLSGAPPTGVRPIPALPARLSITGADAGQLELIFSGFGKTETGQLGTKIAVRDTLGLVCESPSGCSYFGQLASDHTLCYAQSPGGPCDGDSGGPALAMRDGAEFVAGVTSFGDSRCELFGCSTKVDDFEPFIQAFIGTVGEEVEGAPCSSPSECATGFCSDGLCCNLACADATCAACAAARGALADGVCTPLAGSCDDGDPCTAFDECRGGRCAGAGRDCSAPDACHLPSACEPATGACAPFSPRPDGASCQDGDDCTTGDACAQGLCQGLLRATCPAPDDCHEDAACAQGRCAAFGPRADGTPCNDEDPCTEGDRCRAGRCVGSRIGCPAPDDCHWSRTCDSQSGACVPLNPKVDGTPCEDGNACTTADRCRAGVCEGAATETACPAKDGCHAPGTCDAAGTCLSAPLADGSPCSGGECRAGSCRPRGCGCGAAAAGPTWMGLTGLFAAGLRRHRKARQAGLAR
jgi:hypothetical protein